jgi:zinc-finger binding domain of transposase IS66/Transposase C of IS166 homeodomain
MSAVALPDLNALPADALRALILAQHEQLISREREIEHLRLLLAKLQRMQFGRKSEKLERQIEQLELRLEELESKRSEQEPSASIPAPVTASSTPITKPTRRALPDHLPRQTHRHEPKEKVCPECQGELRKLGEDVSEMLEYVPASFVVIRHVRPKLSCTKCDTLLKASLQSHHDPDQRRRHSQIHGHNHSHFPHREISGLADPRHEAQHQQDNHPLPHLDGECSLLAGRWVERGHCSNWRLCGSFDHP